MKVDALSKYYSDEQLNQVINVKPKNRITIGDETFESEIRGLYPCGEGAGYAGGITSAAMDGLKIAEAIAKKYLPCYD